MHKFQQPLHAWGEKELDSSPEKTYLARWQLSEIRTWFVYMLNMWKNKFMRTGNQTMSKFQTSSKALLSQRKPHTGSYNLKKTNITIMSYCKESWKLWFDRHSANSIKKYLHKIIILQRRERITFSIEFMRAIMLFIYQEQFSVTTQQVKVSPEVTILEYLSTKKFSSWK